MTAKKFLAGCLVAGLIFSSSASNVHSQEQEPHSQVSLKPLYFLCEYQDGGESKTSETALKLPSQMLAGRLDQLVEIPAPLSPIRLLEYLPLAAFEQKVIPDRSGSGKPAIRMSIDGPKLSYQRCLIVDNSERNRLNSLIGSWRYGAVADGKERDDLFEKFKKEMSREPRLLVSRTGDKIHELPAKVGLDETLEELGCSVRVLEFYPNFSRDYNTDEPFNQSEKRLNPAIQVEIERGGDKERRWVFARYPDFKMDKSKALPYQVTLDCPVETESPRPEFVILTVGRSGNEVWLRYKGTTSSKSLAVGEKIAIPDSNYAFHLAQFEPAGRLVETYHPTDSRKNGVTALQIETIDTEGGKNSTWLTLGIKQTITTAKGPVTVMFGPRQTGVPTGHPKFR